MLTGPQDHAVDRVFVQFQQTCSGSYTNPLGSMVDDLSNRLGRQMQAKQCTGLGGCKAFSTGAAVKQITAFVLAILTSNCNVAVISQAVILALFVGTEVL